MKKEDGEKEETAGEVYDWQRAGRTGRSHTMSPHSMLFKNIPFLKSHLAKMCKFNSLNTVMYLLDTESHGNLFFFKSTNDTCKVSQNKDPINFSVVTGFLAFSFPSSSFSELAALSHFFLCPWKSVHQNNTHRPSRKPCRLQGQQASGITHHWACPQ